MAEELRPYSAKWHARKALYSALKQTSKHLARGDVDAALGTMGRAMENAQLWLDGRHPKQHKAVDAA